jgi:hypothetical protein
MLVRSRVVALYRHRKLCGGSSWDSGLWPQPASFSVLTALWTPQNQSWTEYWLRMLRRESAEAWHCLRQRELTEVAERDRLSAFSRLVLHRTRATATAAPNGPGVWVAGNSSNLAAFRAGLAACLEQTELQGSVCISGIAPADQGKVLGLPEQGGLRAQLAGQKRLV